MRNLKFATWTFFLILFASTIMLILQSPISYEGNELLLKSMDRNIIDIHGSVKIHAVSQTPFTIEQGESLIESEIDEDGTWYAEEYAYEIGPQEFSDGYIQVFGLNTVNMLFTSREHMVIVTHMPQVNQLIIAIVVMLVTGGIWAISFIIFTKQD